MQRLVFFHFFAGKCCRRVVLRYALAGAVLICAAITRRAWHLILMIGFPDAAELLIITLT